MFKKWVKRVSISATRGFSVDTSPTNEKPPELQQQSGDTQKPNKNESTPPPIVPEIDEYQTASSTVSDIAGDVAGLNSQVGGSSGGGGGGVGDYGGNGITDGSIINANKKNSLSHQESIDYDALYEEEEDTSISMEAHGSMISHLLSQVKIGMDLTKVVLPTFILERRSLLEMYADYFAHPDLFLKY
ncbi:hypothetical protein DOY81_013970, partial [Sarcophaga bullata]